MHDYSIDKHPKEKVLFALAFIAISIAPPLNNFLNQAFSILAAKTGWEWALIKAIPVFTLFLLIYVAFDKYCWRWRWIRKFLLVPDLNGLWDCEGRTTLKDGQPNDIQWSGTITITQSWSKILIHLRTRQSSSKSVSASISHEPGVGYRLLYQYDSDPDASEHELNRHSGSAEILFILNDKSGEGHYYTDQHRNTVGTLTLTRRRQDGNAA